MNAMPYFCRPWQERAFYSAFASNADYRSKPGPRSRITDRARVHAFQTRVREIFGCDPTANGPIYFVALPYALPSCPQADPPDRPVGAA